MNYQIKSFRFELPADKYLKAVEYLIDKELLDVADIKTPVRGSSVCIAEFKEIAFEDGVLMKLLI